MATSIRAGGVDTALAIARTNPAIRAGGGVEVRPVHSGGVQNGRVQPVDG